MTRTVLHTILVLTISATAACNRADAEREAREAAAGIRTAAADAGDRLADGWLTAKVQAKFFADDDIKARYIDVSSRDGAVTLHGFVESDALRQKAVEIARVTDGVVRVDDQLLIGQAPPAADTGASPIPTTGVDESGSGGATAPDDAMVTSLIQARYFVEPVIKTRHIDVTTVNGVVTLRGTVASDDERARALLLARTTQGVQRVEDALRIDASLTTPPDAGAVPADPLPAAPVPGASLAPPAEGR